MRMIKMKIGKAFAAAACVAAVAFVARCKAGDVVFAGPTGRDIEFAVPEEGNPHSWIVQGADFDKVWDIRVGGVRHQVGFSYRFGHDRNGERRLMVESLVVSMADGDFRVNTVPLAWFFGNRFPYNGTDLTPGAEMPPVQSNLSFGVPTAAGVEETEDGLVMRLSFDQGMAQTYTLRKAAAGEWIPPGFTKDIFPYAGLKAEVALTFSRHDPYRVSMETTRTLEHSVENHNGFNLLTQVIYSSGPVGVSWPGTGQMVAPAFASKRITALELLSGGGWQMLGTEEFDKNPKVFAAGGRFDDGWVADAGGRRISVSIPGFRKFAVMSPYTDVLGTDHIPNNLYVFRYNGWYDYAGRGYPFAVIEQDPVVVRATVSETHFGKGWMSVEIPAGTYRDKAVVSVSGCRSMGR